MHALPHLVFKDGRRETNAKLPMATFVDDYIHGRVDVEGDFRDFMRARAQQLNYRFVWQHVRFLLTNFLPEVLIHSRAQDIRIGREHYDRGNDFFGGFLGDTMVYTSAFFQSEADSLEEAQARKLQLICEKLQLKKGERMLDLGCGWGTLIATAARDYGVDATGVTVAEKGAAFANQRIADWGCADRARAEVMDYRDIPAQEFDKISCIEMAEHVGVRRFGTFLKQVCNLLKDDGVFLLQIAGLRARSSLLGFQAEDLIWGLFMNRFIFPGADASMPLSFVVKHLEKAGFEVHSVENVGVHYSLTISRWYDNWMRNRKVVTEAYGESWFRLWQIFLAWSVDIAAQGSSTCFQLVANKNLNGFDRKRWVGGYELGERPAQKNVSAVAGMKRA